MHMQPGRVLNVLGDLYSRSLCRWLNHARFSGAECAYVCMPSCLDLWLCLIAGEVSGRKRRSPVVVVLAR